VVVDSHVLLLVAIKSCKQAVIKIKVLHARQRSRLSPCKGFQLDVQLPLRTVLLNLGPKFSCVGISRNSNQTAAKTRSLKHTAANVVDYKKNHQNLHCLNVQTELGSLRMHVLV